MFALLQAIPMNAVSLDHNDEALVHDGEVEVLKVDASEERLKDYLAAYQFRFRAAIEDWEALDPGGEWGPEHDRLDDELHEKYRVTGVIAEETTFLIVEIFDGDDDDGTE